jgi:uncharacterized membrane protein
MFFKLLLISFPVFFLIDMVWLVLVARNFYSTRLGFLMRTDVGWIPAVIFYILFIAGMVTFVITPAVQKQSWFHALLYGAFYGLVTYATYDLTNLATIRDWPLVVTIVDLAWGMTVSALVSTITWVLAVKVF